MYRVLYRKWRPQVFADVVGQPQVTLTLSAQVRENRLSHAYLFTGSRGTGKTTCAKIFSKAVNCLNPKNGDPCNECEICRGIDSGTVLDIVEIDAASNRGIDDIRLLRDEANFTPSQAKYRVYIIDEVHMLTIEAFNALLKTLEEPPEHVKFILATTEVHKLPATILSRCQRFDFKRIEPSIIAERLTKIAVAENSELDSDAAMLIARIADGGMRDALSLLDRCISVSPKVTADLVARSAGLMGRESIYSLVRAIANGDTAQSLTILDDLHNASCDTERLITELTGQFRNFLIIKTVKSPENLIVCTSDELKSITELSELFTGEQLMYILGVLSDSAEAIKRTQNRRIEAELALIRLCSPATATDVSALNARISALEKQISELKATGGIAVSASAQNKNSAVLPKTEKATENNNKAEQIGSEPIAEVGFDDLPFTGEEEPVSFEEAPFDSLEAPNDEIPFDEEYNARAEEVSAPASAAQSDFAGFGAETQSGGFSSMFNAEDDGDDEAFDFDSFMKEYGSQQPDDASDAEPESVPQPEYEPPADQSNAAAPDGDKLDSRAWVRIVLETEQSFPPLIGVLTNSSAYLRGDSLYIKFANSNAKFLVREETLNRYVSAAAAKILGKTYLIKTEI